MYVYEEEVKPANVIGISSSRKYGYNGPFSDEDPFSHTYYISILYDGLEKIDGDGVDPIGDLQLRIRRRQSTWQNNVIEIKDIKYGNITTVELSLDHKPCIHDMLNGTFEFSLMKEGMDNPHDLAAHGRGVAVAIYYFDDTIWARQTLRSGTHNSNMGVLGVTEAWKDYSIGNSIDALENNVVGQGRYTLYASLPGAALLTDGRENSFRSFRQSNLPPSQNDTDIYGSCD